VDFQQIEGWGDSMKAPIFITRLRATSLALAILGLTGLCARASTETVLYTFEGGNSGWFPEGALVMDASGNFYGTAGGGPPPRRERCGIVYKLTPKGAKTNLAQFRCGGAGGGPIGPVIIDETGNIYGATLGGGQIGKGCHPASCGTIFKIAADGEESIIYDLRRRTGTNPESGLILDNSGNLTGSAFFGGHAFLGAVFQITTHGKGKVLYSFKGGSDGANPYGGLISDGAGNLYGTTSYGGANNNCSDCGTVFQLTSRGTETVLYAFKGGSDGKAPQGTLIRDNSGNLYGTTEDGGGCTIISFGCGTVFKIAPNGTETILHVFAGGTDGAFPSAGVIADKQGNLYGTTLAGAGTGCNGYGCGTVFEIAPNGTETILYSFTDDSGGARPAGGVIFDEAGNLVGTTEYGGNDNGPCGDGNAVGCGVVFEIKK
jgi:uncharacterized repeat protein (TIGR03803 family)